ncbi:MAG: serine/threonine kinase [Myxococcales bacterium]|nr:serine/threonine kinase [Myxococcales bacterium]
MIRALWGAANNEEESRAYLQARLTVFSRVMFWSLLVDLVFVSVLYEVYPRLRPLQNHLIFGEAVLCLAALAVFWRVLLVRRRMSYEALYRLDLVYGLWVGSGFALSVVFAPDLVSAAPAAMMWSSFMVFTRALILPSSGWRTVIVSALTLVPINLAGVYLAFAPTKQELPGPALVLAGLVFSSVVVLLAATGSRIIYGLRRQVTAAMQLGQYTLDRKIGEGGMGAVYRAHHLMLRRPTAVKLLLPDRVGAENLERFEREVQHMSQLTHWNTVAVFDYGRSPEGVLYYAMEYLGGGINLEQLVVQHGPQPAQRVVHILSQVCGALQEAHEQGFIHRDVKPANIILCERGGLHDVAKVVDFGLVKEITADTGASQQVILGTPAYVAPEAVTDPAHIGPAVDLYALGCVGYFMLTGKRVFEGKTAVDICIQHVTATPKRPSELAAIALPVDLEDVLMKCLSKKPSDRYASATELAAALGALSAYRDWSDGLAKSWWQQFRGSEANADVSSSTITMQVDLGERA